MIVKYCILYKKFDSSLCKRTLLEVKSLLNIALRACFDTLCIIIIITIKFCSERFSLWLVKVFHILKKKKYYLKLKVLNWVWLIFQHIYKLKMWTALFC